MSVFDAPVDDFNVSRVQVVGGKTATAPALDGPSIFIVVEGSGAVEGAGKTLEITKGNVFFLSANSGACWWGWLSCRSIPTPSLPLQTPNSKQP